MTAYDLETRDPAVAGQFYPASPARLAAEVADFIERGRARHGEAHGRVRALIAPHAGYVYSGGVAGEAYALIRGEDVSSYRRVVVLAPSHRVYFRGVSLGGFAKFATPLGALPVDVEACRALAKACPLFSLRPEPHIQEHALEVQLPFIQTVLPDVSLIPAVCGEMRTPDIREAAGVLERILRRPDTLWVVSSDFTHYGYSFGYVPFTGNVPERIRELDQGAIECILAGDASGFLDYVDRTVATICGSIPIALLLEVVRSFEHDAVEGILVDYTTSGELTGDYSHSVSYAAIAWVEKNCESGEEAAGTSEAYDLTEQEKQALLRLAREAIRTAFEGRITPVPEEVLKSPRLTAPGACFVTLHKHGRLRGCIGSLEAVEPLYENVIRNARNAAFHDPRFYPLTPEELPEIEIEISVLTPPRPVRGPEEIVLGRHGIILEKGPASAVFLPQVPIEQGWDLETTLRHLSMKAGLGPEDWRRGADFRVFEAIVFS